MILISDVISAQKVSWLTNDGNVRFDLFDSLDVISKKHIYNFKVTNNSDRTVYFVSGGNHEIFNYTTIHRDSSGVLFGIGVTGSPHYYDHSEIFSLIDIKPGESRELGMFTCNYSNQQYSLAIHCDFLYEQVKIKPGNMIPPSNYLKKCERFDLKMSLGDCTM